MNTAIPPTSLEIPAIVEEPAKAGCAPGGETLGYLAAEISRLRSALSLATGTPRDTIRQYGGEELGLLDWAETLLCNAVPMSHCTQKDWDAALADWRDRKHNLRQRQEHGDDPKCWEHHTPITGESGWRPPFRPTDLTADIRPSFPQA